MPPPILSTPFVPNTPALSTSACALDIIECDRSVAVDVRKEHPADIIIAAINIDPRATDRPVAAVDRDRCVIGDGCGVRNIHVDHRATLGISADAATRVVDLSKQRIRGQVCCGYVDRGISADCCANEATSEAARVVDSRRKASAGRNVARVMLIAAFPPMLPAGVPAPFWPFKMLK